MSEEERGLCACWASRAEVKRLRSTQIPPRYRQELQGPQHVPSRHLSSLDSGLCSLSVFPSTLFALSFFSSLSLSFPTHVSLAFFLPLSFPLSLSRLPYPTLSLSSSTLLLDSTDTLYSTELDVCVYMCCMCVHVLYVYVCIQYVCVCVQNISLTRRSSLACLLSIPLWQQVSIHISMFTIYTTVPRQWVCPTRHDKPQESLPEGLTPHHLFLWLLPIHL